MIIKKCTKIFEYFFQIFILKILQVIGSEIRTFGTKISFEINRNGTHSALHASQTSNSRPLSYQNIVTSFWYHANTVFTENTTKSLRLKFRPVSNERNDNSTAYGRNGVLFMDYNFQKYILNIS